MTMAAGSNGNGHRPPLTYEERKELKRRISVVQRKRMETWARIEAKGFRIEKI